MKRLILYLLGLAIAPLLYWLLAPPKPVPLKHVEVIAKQGNSELPLSELSPEVAAEVKANAEKEKSLEAAKERVVADAKWSREDALKKVAHMLADTVNQNHLKVGKIMGKTGSKDFYNELYLEIYRRVDAETIGLERQAFAQKAKEVGEKWASQKMLGD